MLSEKNFTEKNLILGRPRCRKNGLVYVLNFVRKKKNFCSEKIPISSEQNQIFLRTKFWPDLNMQDKDYRDKMSYIHACRTTNEAVSF